MNNKDIKEKNLHTSYDYYALLGFNNLLYKDKSNLSHKELNKAYIKKLKKYHPDRIPTDTGENEKKQLNIMYKLIQESGDILLDKNKRKAYDLESSVASSDGYLNQKNNFDNFMKLQENNISEDSKRQAKLNFENEFKAMNEKHNLNKYSAISLTKNDTNRRLEDLIQQRDIDDIEIKPKRIFNDGEKFDKSKFMKAFGKHKLKHEKSNEIINYNDISAFNDTETTFGCGDNYGNLYREDEFKGNIIYGTINNSDNSDNSDDDLEIDSVDSNDIDDIDDIYLKEDDTITPKDLSNALNDLIQKRNDEVNTYSNKSYSGYESAINDKFGPSNSLGFMVGTDYKGDQLKNKNNKQLEEELDVYKKMISFENTNDNTNTNNDIKSTDSYDIDV